MSKNPLPPQSIYSLGVLRPTGCFSLLVQLGNYIKRFISLNSLIINYKHDWSPSIPSVVAPLNSLYSISLNYDKFQRNCQVLAVNGKIPSFCYIDP